MNLGPGPAGLRLYVNRLCYLSHAGNSPLSSRVDRLGCHMVELILSVDDVVVATVNVRLDIDVGFRGPGVEQSVGHLLEQSGGRRIDRVIRGKAILFIKLLALVEGDALLFDVVLADPLVDVGVLPVVGGDRTAEVVTDRRRLGRVVEDVS